LFAAITTGQTFDIIASNPPYVSQSEYEKLAKTVKDFEPRAALVAGPSGAEVIERLIPQSADRLNPGGWLLLETSPMIEPAVRALIEAESRLQLAPTIKDLAGHLRVVQARRK
jgi:release factor glutamine methyltransferase